MAIELVGYVTTATSGSLSLTSLTGGSASAPSENDIVFVAVAGGGSDTDISISGYTEVADLYANSTLDTNLGVFYKVMGSTPDTSVDIPSLNSVRAVVYVLRGFDLGTPADATATTSTATNTSRPNPAAITTVTNDAWVIILSAGTSTGTWTAPSGYTNAATRNGTTVSVMVASKLVATAGSENPGSWSTTADNQTFYSAASVTFALRPASTGVTATLSATQDGQTVTSAGAVAVKAAAAITQDGNTIAATGLGAQAAVASLDLTQAGNTLSADGLVKIGAAAALTQEDQTGTAEGTVAVTAQASLTQDNNVTLLPITGAATLSQAGDAVSAELFKFAPPPPYTSVIALRPVEMVEIIQPKCSRTFGVSPCLAAGDACWNTDATCKYREALDMSDAITLRFAPDDVYEWQSNDVNLLAESGDKLLSEAADPFLIDYYYQPALDLPVLAGYATAPTVLNVASGSRDKSPLGYRAVSRVNVKDFPWNDVGTDPYVLTRSYRPDRLGSFWSKWLARNPYHVGYTLNIYEGYLGQPLSAFTRREYVIEKVDNGKDGVSITAKDVLRKVTDTNLAAPYVSRGELAAAVTISATEFTVAGAVLSDYPETGYVRINSEIIAYSILYETSGGNLYFGGLTRGMAGTTATAHSQNNRVQRVIYYDAEPFHEIIYDLLVNWGGIPAQYIDLDAWALEKNTYRTVYDFTAYLSEPAKIDDLVGEVCLQSLSNIWWDERTQQIVLRAVKPEPSPYLLTDDDAIVAGSFSIREKPEERTSQAHVYYLQRTPIPSVTEKTNYSRVSVYIDVNKQIQYGGEPQIRELFCRFIPSQAIANTVAQTYLDRFSDVRKEITFDLSAKDAANIWTGSVVTIRHFLDVDFTGAAREGEWLITSAEVARNGLTYRFTAEDNEKGGVVWTWLDSSGNDAAGDPQPYVWLDDSGNDSLGNPQPYRWL